MVSHFLLLLLSFFFKAIPLNKSQKSRMRCTVAQKPGYKSLCSKEDKKISGVLMRAVSQAEKQMPSTHKSTQLLRASVDNYLYRN